MVVISTPQSSVFVVPLCSFKYFCAINSQDVYFSLVSLKREILKILGKNLAGDYRMRKITSPDVFKIKHDHDVINLKHNDKVEIVHESDKKSNVAAYFNIYN